MHDFLAKESADKKECLALPRKYSSTIQLQTARLIHPTRKSRPEGISSSVAVRGTGKLGDAALGNHRTEDETGFRAPYMATSGLIVEKFLTPFRFAPAGVALTVSTWTITPNFVTE